MVLKATELTGKYQGEDRWPRCFPHYCFSVPEGVDKKLSSSCDRFLGLKREG